MNRARIDYLHERFLKGILTAAESMEWKRAVDDPLSEDQMLAFIEQAWKQTPDSALADMPELRAHEILNQVVAEPQVRTKVYRLWPRIAVAAAAVAALALCVYFFNAPKGGRHLEGSVATRDLLNDIAPGRNGATITLANGKVIALSGEKKGVIIGDTGMKYSDGSTDPSLPTNRDRFSSRGERGVMLIAETRKGQTYEFVLPDGTKVWLNADSKISFPSQFDGKERKILLSGEAYFAVVHNEKQPFRVESNGQVVEDIGTEFNISAYTDEKYIKTTLVEGSASVASLSPLEGEMPAGQRGVILKPNQQAILSPLEGEMPAGQRGGNNLKVTTIDPEEAIAWKQGYFKFNEQPLEELLKKVARWYNVEIVYTAAELKNIPFSGTITRYGNVSKLLKNLERTELVHFKIEERRIVVVK